MSSRGGVLVLKGGRSAEREVSLNTGAQVGRALSEAGFEVTELDPVDPAFLGALRDSTADVAFICLHGRWGEDGTVQGLLELIAMPYVGSGVLASALAMDKAMSKLVYGTAGLRTPDWMALRAPEPVDPDEIVAALGEKVVVKPANEGSAVGVGIVHERSELVPALDEAFSHDRTVIVECFVEGAEVTVGVLGNDGLMALPTLEIVPAHEFYDYDSKYVPGMSEHIIPARISEAAREECARLALGAHRALGCRGMSRSDTIVTASGEVFLLETNTIPGMTATSLYPEAAAAAGIPFPELCARLVELALEGFRR